MPRLQVGERVQLKMDDRKARTPDALVARSFRRKPTYKIDRLVERFDPDFGRLWTMAVLVDFKGSVIDLVPTLFLKRAGAVSRDLVVSVVLSALACVSIAALWAYLSAAMP